MSTEAELIRQAEKAFLLGEGARAESFYLQAAQMGSGHAAHNLGVLYITGAPGVEPNYEKSQYWLNYSLESGFEAKIATNPKWFKNET